jgi:hypothetical protein
MPQGQVITHCDAVLIHSYLNVIELSHRVTDPAEADLTVRASMALLIRFSLAAGMPAAQFCEPIPGTDLLCIHGGLINCNERRCSICGAQLETPYGKSVQWLRENIQFFMLQR